MRRGNLPLRGPKVARLQRALSYGKSSYLPVGSLISYWTNITVTSILVVVLASIGGAVMVASRRSVLTSGITIALALVPSATLVSLGLVSGQLDVAGKGLLRWVIEVGIVFAASALVFAWKRAARAAAKNAALNNVIQAVQTFSLDYPVISFRSFSEFAV